MKIRNVQTSLLVLAGLIILSLAFYVSAEGKSLSANNIFLDSDQDGLSDKEEKALGTDPHKRDTDDDGYSDGVEVTTGYNPLQKAPGDKLIVAEKKEPSAAPANAGKGNQTETAAQKISLLIDDSIASKENISLDELEVLASELMLPQTAPKIQLPEIKKEDFNIKKQNYSKYSKEKAAAKKREDFSNYITTVAYILSTNSPHPITSNTNLSDVFDSLSQEILQAVSLRDTASLKKISTNGEKIQEQLLEMEIPEDLVDTHIKIIQFARYSQEAKKLLNPQEADPIADIANLSHLTGLITEVMSFKDELLDKFNEYGLVFDEDLQKQLKNLGLEVPKDLQAELEKELADSEKE